MSLLLDALKRAEQEKLARGERPDLQIVSPQDATPPASEAAAREAAAASHAAPEGSLELQPPAQQAQGPPPKASSPAAAQAVFQAKLPPGTARDPPGRAWLFAAAGVVAIAVIAAGAYVWYAMQALAPAPIPARRMAGPLAPPPPAPVIPTPAIPPAGSTTPVLSGTPEKGPLPAAVTTTTATRAPIEPRAPPARPPREQAAADLLREAPAPRDPPVQLDRAPPSARIPAEVAAGYEALRNSDLVAARRAYEAALAADTANVDALLGMATVEARSGNIASAGAAYRKALELDPRNATALAGMATLADPSRRGTVEPRLREDVMRYPQSPALHFALGNVYSSQARWSEAQGEFFEAHRLDPSNADIAHNLAVALDNLGQPRVAAQFYRRALESARVQPAQFDPAPVARRLQELGP
ncbi:MAG: hypothetical protein ABIR98_13800 [Usitatibacter sp.]